MSTAFRQILTQRHIRKREQDENMILIRLDLTMYWFLYFQILPLIPKLVAVLKSESSPCATRIANLIHCCMYHHAGYPDLYDPILDVLNVCT